MVTKRGTPVPVTLILRDSVTGREVAIPTGEVWLETRNIYSTSNVLDFNASTLIGQEAIITADFFNLQNRMNQQQEQIEDRKGIER